VRIEWHPAVIGDDLPGNYAHIALDNPNAAEHVLDAVEATFADIAAQLEIGVPYPTRNPLMKAVRMLPVNGFNNYLVLYRLEGDAVRVLYVVHGARHLPRLFRRERRE
jgi:plasmid stabilization system protein ParE